MKTILAFIIFGILLSSNLYFYCGKADLITTNNNVNISIGDDPPYYLLIIHDLGLGFSKIDKFLTHKRNRGLRPTYISVDTIKNDNTINGKDLPEKIKYFIKYAVENWQTEYVLLIGTDPYLPARNVISYDTLLGETEFPSDLYYADIYNHDDQSNDLCTWDKNGNGIFGEVEVEIVNDENRIFRNIDGIDLYPDVYIGRLPCKNADEQESVLSKIIDYETSNMDVYKKNKILQIAGDTFAPPNDFTGVCEGEEANKKIAENIPNYYEAIQLFGSYGNLKTQNIKTYFGQVDYVDFSGHGCFEDGSCWKTYAPEDNSTILPNKDGFTYRNAAELSNDKKFPVAVIDACMCGKFTAGNNFLAWALVKNPNGGSIACFAQSSFAYGGVGIGFLDCFSGWMEIQFFEELFKNNVTGEIWADAISAYIDEFYTTDGRFWNCNTCKVAEQWILIGDPSLNKYIDNTEEPNEELDQKNTEYEIEYKLDGSKIYAQSFSPEYNQKLTRIELYIASRGNPDGKIIVSIRDELSGEDKRILSKSVSDISNSFAWVEFDIDDIKLQIGGTYYIIYRTDCSESVSNYYRLGCSNFNSYDGGEAFQYNYVWSKLSSVDFCFKTYAINSEGNEPPIITDIIPPEGSSFKVKEELNFTVIGVDPEDDRIQYKFDWGDGTQTEWLKLVNSGEPFEQKHSWDDKGTWKVSVQGKDDKGNIGEWYDLDVSIDSKVKIIPRLSKIFLENPVVKTLIKTFFKVNFDSKISILN